MANILMIVLNNFCNDSRVLKECAAVREMGHDVTVFAIHDEPLPEYEEKEDYRLIRFRLKTRSLPKHSPLLLFKYTECMMRMLFKSLHLNIDVVHCHDVSALIIGSLIGSFKKCSVIYDSHELWSGYYRKNAPFSRYLMIRVASIIERFLMRRANAIITVSDSIADCLAEHGNVKKPYVIKNTPALCGAASISTTLLRRSVKIDDGRRIILYQGNVGAGMGIEDIFRALKMIKEDACMVFLGADEGICMDYVHRYSAEESHRVFVHQKVPYEVLLRYTCGADIGLSLCSSESLSYKLALPNKLFEYIQAGVPVVATELPEMSRIIHEHGIGETYPEGDHLALANVINRLLDDEGLLDRYRSHSREAAKKLCWEEEVIKLNEIYDHVIRDNVVKR